tara:strand:+ start:337 stop:549 length:213 start_codon:yes stop_codon:yes gene_type:complete
MIRRKNDSSQPDFGSSPGARTNMDAGLEDQVNEAIEFFPAESGGTSGSGRLASSCGIKPNTEDVVSITLK